MIEFHADDYGMFPEASRRIIECINHGAINAISMMPNGPCLEECMKILKTECTKPVKLSVHLNLMTEKPLSDPKKIPDLVDARGYFCVTYKKLLLAGLSPKNKKRIQAEIKEELGAQIERCLPYYTDGARLRLDSHRHFHMVPIVFDAIAELVNERGYDPEYIRIIHEKTAFYRHFLRFEHFRPINIIKAVLLNTLGKTDKRRHPALYARGEADFASILLSGIMTKKNLSILLQNIQAKPGAFRQDIELMFHPGLVTRAEDKARIDDAEDAAYMSDEMRKQEMDAVMSIADTEAF